MSRPAVFYFDLASPLAYVASEQVMHLLSGPVDWQPVLAAELPGPKLFDERRCQTDQQRFREEIAHSAERLGLQPLRWPQPFPFDSSLAMRAATYAASIGRGIPFAQAAFRQAFAGGHNLESADFVLIAAAACEMHPNAVLQGTELRSVAKRLKDVTREAAEAGASDVPAVRLGPRARMEPAIRIESAAGHSTVRPESALGTEPR